MKCPKCNRQIPDDAVYCPICGEKAEETPALKPGGGYCPFCGTYNDADSRFCENCGEELPEPEKDSGTGKEKKTLPVQVPELNKKMVAGIAAAVVVIVIAACVFVWMSSGDGGDKTAADSAQTAEVEEPLNTEAEMKEQEAGASGEEKEVPEKADDTAVAEKQEAEKDGSAVESEYVIPESSTRLLTDSDVSSLSLQQLNYARNEIYARHGRRFKSQELQSYFESKSWYSGTISPEDFDAYHLNDLNSVEKANAEFLKSREYAISASGYQLDQ